MKNGKHKIEVGFNALGMPIFSCKTHMKKGKDELLGDSCCQYLIRKMESMFNWQPKKK